MFRLSRALRNSSEGIKNRLLVTISAPAEVIAHKTPVESVTVPGVEGVFTITNNHSQTVAQLAPGVITVRNGTTTNEYFISSGFLYYKSAANADNNCTAEIVGAEIVPVEALDKDRIAQTLSELLAAPKTTSWDSAKVQLGQELLSNALRAAK